MLSDAGAGAPVLPAKISLFGTLTTTAVLTHCAFADWTAGNGTAPNFLRHAAAGCYRRVQRLLDSGVFMRPEFGKPRECRRVYLVVTDVREPVAAPVNRKAPLVETWWMHAKV